MSNRGRTADRQRWPIRRFTLGSQPGDDLSAQTTAEERLEMMWPLALEAWALAGFTLPNYRRDETPVRAVPASRRRQSEDA
ncbi:MAG: hypothetical protein ACM3O7_11125 [Acidobacteriota bacterium]